MALLIIPFPPRTSTWSYANTIIAIEPGETKSKQLVSSAEAEAEVRKEKKKSKTITEDETEAQVRKEKKKKKSRSIEEDEEQVGVFNHSDINGEIYARKEKKKKKSRTIEGDEERDSDGEMCSPKRRKSGERNNCLKKSKKQLVA